MWVLNEIIQKKYPENMKKIVGAVWELRLPGFLFRFNTLIFIHFFKYKTIETHARTFSPLNISVVGSVDRPSRLPELCSPVFSLTS